MYPVLFRIGSFEIRAYGVMIALGFIAAAFFGMKEAKRKGYNPEIVQDLIFFAMIFGLLGARIYYVLFSEPFWYFSHPFEILAVWKGGLAIHGGLIAGFVVGIWFSKSRKIPFWKFADIMAPAMIIGQAVGRGACTLNGCSYGIPTSLPWGVTFTSPDALLPPEFKGIALHPTQFYELFIDLGIFLYIWSARKKIDFDGQLFLKYAMLYGVARFFVEFFRGDSLMIGGVIRAAQLTSILILLASSAQYINFKTSYLKGLVNKEAKR